MKYLPTFPAFAFTIIAPALSAEPLIGLSHEHRNASAEKWKSYRKHPPSSRVSHSA